MKFKVGDKVVKDNKENLERLIYCDVLDEMTVLEVSENSVLVEYMDFVRNKNGKYVNTKITKEYDPKTLIKISDLEKSYNDFQNELNIKFTEVAKNLTSAIDMIDNKEIEGMAILNLLPQDLTEQLERIGWNSSSAFC